MLLKPTVKADENRVLVTARLVREYYFPAIEKHAPDWILIPAIRELMKLQPDATPEGLFEQLVRPPAAGSPGLLSRYRIASLAAGLGATDDAGRDSAEINIFSGGRQFSFTRLSAMASFFAGRGQVCKTKLNHLLFYSDFVNYVSFGRSISGARYVRQQGGPVLDQYDTLLKTMVYTGVVRLQAAEADSESELVVVHEPSIESFTLLEVVTLYWVHANFNTMTVSDISEYSQHESVYRFTQQNNYIAYEYSRLLKKLPERESELD